MATESWRRSAPLKIFLSEFVCGGGWPDGPLPPSLATEGRAMLLAVAEDLARNGDIRVVTTWDHRLSPPPWPRGVEAHVVHGQTEEAALGEELAQQADGIWVIAPECDDLLARRVLQLKSRESISLNCSVETIRLCSDKLHLAEWLTDRAIPTPRTFAAAPAAPVSPTAWRGCVSAGEPQVPWPIVIKPRDGAGSQSTFVVSGPGVLPAPLLGWETVTAVMAAEPWPGGWIIQPLIAGRSFSLAAIIRSPEDFDLLPAGEQHLSSDGRLTYQGGTIPARSCRDDEMESLVSRVIRKMPGLFGWVGFDLLLPEDPTAPPVLIEINPRLTTSYIGYRALAGENLARRIVGGATGGPLGFRDFIPLDRGGGNVRPRGVRFESNGTLRELSNM